MENKQDKQQDTVSVSEKPKLNAKDLLRVLKENFSDVDECYTHALTSFQDGSFKRVTNKKLKMTISLNADECLKKDCFGIPMKFEQWELYPLVMLVKFKDENNGENND